MDNWGCYAARANHLGLDQHVTHVAPADQPSSVHQIAERLYPAYAVDGGTVHLAGCTLEDRLFVRLEFAGGEQPVTVYIDGDGREVDATMIDALGMAEVAQLAKPPRPFAEQLERLIDSGIRAVAARFPEGAAPELLTTAALWCKFTEGKLCFSLGENTADLPFADWSRTLRPPPFICPHTGCETFHVAATDDGRIAAAEKIERCAETGCRVLSDDLVTCSATGRRVALELTTVCPISGQPVLRNAVVTCRTCGQSVSPPETQRGQCAACRRLRPVDKADTRVARLLEEHPLLDRWRNWRISEAAKVYVLTASRWLRRLLLVVDKDSLELTSVATGSRISVGWNAVKSDRYEDALRG